MGYRYSQDLLMSVHTQFVEGAGPAHLYIASGDGGIYLLPLSALFEAAARGKGEQQTALLQGQLQLQACSTWQKVFFLASHPQLGVLYALDIGAGVIAAYGIGPGGQLQLLGRCESGDAAPCHLAVDPQGRFLLVAHYNGGLGYYPLDATGVPQAAGAQIPGQTPEQVPGLAPEQRTAASALARLSFEGSGPVAARQSGPHPHGVVLDHSGQWAYVADLGTDSIYSVHVDAAAAALTHVAEHRVALAGGDGPRHCVLSPDGRLAAVVNELSNTVTLFDIRRDSEAEPGCWVQRDRQPTLPEGWTGVSHTAEIAFNAAGNTLYVTNRGHDSVAVFAVDAAAGKLGKPDWIMAGGKSPQHLLLVEGGAQHSAGVQGGASALLLVANAGSGDVAVFAVKGAVEAVVSISVSKPLCLALA